MKLRQVPKHLEAVAFLPKLASRKVIKGGRGGRISKKQVPLTCTRSQVFPNKVSAEASTKSKIINTKK